MQTSLRSLSLKVCSCEGHHAGITVISASITVRTLHVCVTFHLLVVPVGRKVPKPVSEVRSARDTRLSPNLVQLD